LHIKKPDADLANIFNAVPKVVDQNKKK
jgi:hypothetical protein